MSHSKIIANSLISLIFVIGVASCDLFKKKEGVSETTQQDEQWATYIDKFDEGWIPSESPIKIKFKHAVVEDQKVGQIVDGVVEVQPEGAFDVLFTEVNEITIAHSERLKSGQIYSVKVFPNKLLGVNQKLEPFTFEVQALKQSYELNVSGIQPGDKKNLMTLSGKVKTSDTADSIAIENSIKASQGTNELTINWSHDDDRLSHEFVISGIERLDEMSKLSLAWTAEEIGLKEKGSKDIEVPALGSFLVTAARAIQKPEQYVEVSFSEALDRNQNLKGLIKLDGSEVKTKIDGSKIRIYPSKKVSGAVDLEVQKNVYSSNKVPLPKDYSAEVIFVSQNPSIRFVGKGSILPPSDNLTVPFEAINVNAVWVTAFKVYENNLHQYLQNQDIYGGGIDKNTGRYLWRKKIQLPSLPLDKWQRYDIKLNDLMEKHSDGLINLTLEIERSVSIYPCEAEAEKSTLSELKSYEGPGNEIRGAGYSIRDRYYEHNGYLSWNDRDNPCKDYYYRYGNKGKASKNFLVSDLGLVAKQGTDGVLHVTATEISSAESVSGAKIKVFNYQQQLLREGKTNSDGMLSLKLDSRPFYLVAEKGEQKGYLRVPVNSAIPTNNFDVGGVKVNKGIKGFIYGERGVWRPGDNIYLTFMLENKSGELPELHPASLDFFDPKGVKTASLINSEPVGGLYTFTLRTDESSPTGTWKAIVKYGDEYFEKSVKIETIVPNRLKLELDLGESPIKLTGGPLMYGIEAQWLNGAIARNLDADIEMTLTPTKTVMEGYSQYIFDDPASQFKKSKKEIFKGELDESGKASFSISPKIYDAPGMLRATFVSRVFERSGAFSKSIQHENLLPYNRLVGVNIPTGDGYMDAIAKDKDHPVQIVSIDSEGNPIKGARLHLRLYKLGWRWWWDQTDEGLANYLRSRSTRTISDEILKTDENGIARWNFAANEYDWGRHLLRICDETSGHCSGKEVYLGWSWSNQSNPDAATQLILGTDKKKYKVGDVAKISIPAFEKGRLLLSIENGSSVLEQKWLDLKPGENRFEVPVTAKMAPNAYVNVSLILPHLDRNTDAPIRLYGVTPILVENPETHLNPVIESPDTVRPESELKFKVTEESGRAMSYTVALVDEGLLGITAYKAPDPHSSFYKREALGVLTWDLFDGVIGAYGANLERLLKIGGGDKNDNDEGDKKRRFPPVVRFLGAFNIAPGETANHSIKLPQYMGAVRLMVVAGNRGAYGKAEQSVKVTQPLTLLATLPRVVGPNESVALPVNIFVNNDQIKDVNVSATSEPIFTLEKSEDSLKFEGPGDKITFLKLKVNDLIGKGKITVKAESEDKKGGKETAEQTVYLESRTPNLPETKVVSKLLEAGETWSPELTINGMEGTNTSSLAVSSMPPINLDSRLGYLISYPHGCVEQTTSSIFPQVLLDNLVNLDSEQKGDIEYHVKEAIEKYKRFQLDDGSFSYWPGESYSNDWASVYVTHFLVVAKDKGYAVPKVMLDNALKSLRSKAATSVDSYSYSLQVSAYRLYVLALSGAPELSSMNRLRNNLLKNEKTNDKYYFDVARWLLSAAYQQAGLKDVAKKLINKSEKSIQHYQNGGYTYSSRLRDNSILMLALNALGDDESSWDNAVSISKELSSEKYHSTQSIAWSLIALAKYSETQRAGGEDKFSIKEADQDWRNLKSINTIYKENLDTNLIKNKTLTVRNDSENKLFMTVSNTGTPVASSETATSSGINLSVRFTDMNGRGIDISSLPQGKDFIAEVDVSLLNTSYDYKIEDIALSMVMPSGWQIRNQRLEGEALADGLDYQDIRDDRVSSYFSLWNDYYWYYRYSDRSHRSQKVKVILNASFVGKFYLPGWQVGAMYDDEVVARTTGQWVEVIAD